MLKKVRAIIDALANALPSASERATARYQVEYANSQELFEIARSLDIALQAIDIDERLERSRTNYSFWSPLLFNSLFKKIVGSSIEKVKRENRQILNIGAGSGELEMSLVAQGMSPSLIESIDISPTSIKRLQEIGCIAYQGRVEDLEVMRERKYDLIFLSYFIDRDENQRATIGRAIRLLNLGGQLILEGLLPAVPVDSGGISYINIDSDLITKGRYPEEDLAEICWAFLALSQQCGTEVKIERLCSGVRYVYSRDGLEALPSYFVVARRNIE